MLNFGNSFLLVVGRYVIQGLGNITVNNESFQTSDNPFQTSAPWQLCTNVIKNNKVIGKLKGAHKLFKCSHKSF